MSKSTNTIKGVQAKYPVGSKVLLRDKDHGTTSIETVRTHGLHQWDVLTVSTPVHHHGLSFNRYEKPESWHYSSRFVIEGSVSEDMVKAMEGDMSVLDNLTKADLVYLLNNKKEKEEEDSDAYAVSCGYCGEAQIFDTEEEAMNYIREDVIDNGHGVDDVTFVVGKKKKLEVSVKMAA